MDDWRERVSTSTRFAVQGASGSGKTTLAKTLSDRMGLAHLELDSVYHQRDWTPLDADEFVRRVTEFTDGPRWVVDGNYRTVREMIWRRAQVIVILDLPRARVMRRLVTRTLVRATLRTELWNTNRESWRNLVSRDPNRNILLWSWRTHGAYHHDVPNQARETAAHATTVVLRSPAEVDAFMRLVRSSG